jgi:hypothetical protein
LSGFFHHFFSNQLFSLSSSLDRSKKRWLLDLTSELLMPPSRAWLVLMLVFSSGSETHFLENLQNIN